MIKYLVVIVLLALLVIFATPQVHAAIALLVKAHDWVADMLKDVFSGGTTSGNVLHDLTASLAIPLLVGLIFSLPYALVKRHWCPYFMEIVWIIWLVQTTALVMAYKPPS